MISIPIVRLAPCAALVLVIGGCAYIGQAPIPSATQPTKPIPVALRHVAEIRPGTPLRVFLPKGDSATGFFLGMSEMDPAGISGRAPALRLGVGDPEMTTRMFESGAMLSEPNAAQVPDTVSFAMDRVKAVLVPGPSNVPPRHTPAIVIVLGVIVLVGGLLGFAASIFWVHTSKPSI